MIVGVLGLQGDVSEHVNMMQRVAEDVRVVRNVSDVKGLDGVVIPGGESTTVSKLLKKYGIDGAIKKAELPIFGTCTGAILLAKEILNTDQGALNLMDISIERNAYGTQVDSFETGLKIPAIGKAPFRGVFIRAPLIRHIGNGVEVLAEHDGNAVLVRQGRFLAATFHPELTDDVRIHEYFLNLLEKR